jgi:hypothetical protein
LRGTYEADGNVGPELSGPVAGRDLAVAAERVRRGIELIEEAPVEALYRKLLDTLTQAGPDADVHGAPDVSKKLRFAYKLAVELGGKLSLLSEEELAVRRRLAALLFGVGELPD